MSDDDDFEKAFMRANANGEFVAAKFAEALRDMMRAFAATDPSSQTLRAARLMRFIDELRKEAQGDISWLNICELAVADLRENKPNRGDDFIDREIHGAATDGLLFLVETSCHDPAARGRASKRRSSFLASMQSVEAARSESRKRWLRGE